MKSQASVAYVSPMRQWTQGMAELARQLALRAAVSQPSVVASGREAAADAGSWVMVVLPFAVERGSTSGALDQFASLLDEFRAKGFRIAIVSPHALSTPFASRSDHTHVIEPDSAPTEGGNPLHRLAQNASIRAAGVSVGQKFRPRLVLQYMVPFFDAGTDISYYCDAPFALYGPLVADADDWRTGRPCGSLDTPLARLAKSMERNTLTRSTMIITPSAGGRDAVLRIEPSAEDRVVVLKRQDEWITAILDCLNAAQAPAPRSLPARSTASDVNGHSKRLEWIKSYLDETPVLEFGCGTGVMITIPLLEEGYDVRGVDLDHESIELGRKLLSERGLEPDRLMERDLASLDERPGVIIASEVLEHIPDGELDRIVDLLHDTLRPGGRLLVTVPNGYGEFELETALWFQLGLGRVLERLGVVRAVKGVKRLFGVLPSNGLPSTLADSPHVQRFTKRSITALLRRHGFKIDEVQASVLFCGPLTVLAMEGFRFFPRLNARAGQMLPRFAAGFFLACTRPSEGLE